jgi:hypothetical protein
MYNDVMTSIEKQNTVRALSDLPLLATNQWRCRLGLHEWLLWGDVRSRTNGGHIYIEQFRTCGHCNLAQRNVLNKSHA